MPTDREGGCALPRMKGIAGIAALRPTTVPLGLGTPGRARTCDRPFAWREKGTLSTELQEHSGWCPEYPDYARPNHVIVFHFCALGSSSAATLRRRTTSGFVSMALWPNGREPGA